MTYDDMICGKCKYHHKDSETGEWICGNPDSEYFAMESEYSEHCPDWEARTKKMA